VRILSVVTLFTPDGAYGGPTRVALNQARALRHAGHEVLLAGAALGYPGPLPTAVDGVPVRLFPAARAIPGTGFAGMWSPAMLPWLRRALDGSDVAHIHLARDLVTLPAALAARRRHIPYVVQTHGMIDPSSHWLARPLDALWTRPALTGAAAILHLTRHEANDVVAVARTNSLPLVEVLNGVPEHTPAARSDVREVLYLARLAPRKRPLVFVEMAQRLAPRHPGVDFTLVGPDEGEGANVRAAIDRDDAGGRITWEGALSLDEAATRVDRATVSVLPSVDEPFPMSVIEAMAAGVPVVVTDTCGLAGRIRRSGAGRVTGPSTDEIAAAVDELLSDVGLADRAGAAGQALTQDELSITAVRRTLEDVYAAAAGVGGGRPKT